MVYSVGIVTLVYPLNRLLCHIVQESFATSDDAIVFTVCCLLSHYATDASNVDTPAIWRRRVARRHYSRGGLGSQKARASAIWRMPRGSGSVIYVTNGLFIMLRMSRSGVPARFIVAVQRELWFFSGDMAQADCPERPCCCPEYAGVYYARGEQQKRRV